MVFGILMQKFNTSKRFSIEKISDSDHVNQDKINKTKSFNKF